MITPTCGNDVRKYEGAKALSLHNKSAKAMSLHTSSTVTVTKM